MLLIWDLHVTRKRIDACLDAIRLLVAQYPDDDTLVFVWDYVYHFSYDRVALHTLFSYRVNLVKQWKQLIVLAWNHDWIHNQFVYAEAKVALELLWEHELEGSLRFVTQPEVLTIQSKECLLFPYTTQFDIVVDTRSEYEELVESTHVKERLSWVANSLLHTMIDEWKQDHPGSDTLLLIHHRYIAGRAFPGQFARFGYGNPALSNHRLDDKRLMMVSWHLHQPFVDQNYCCIGSLWSTSPLEINQQKYLFRYDTTAEVLTYHPVSINPYLQYTLDEIQDAGVQEMIEQRDQESRLYLHAWNIPLQAGERLWTIDHAAITLTIVNEDQSDWLSSVSDELKQSVGTLRIKQTSATLDTLIHQMQDSSLSLDKSFADWKSLLQEFLKAKYGAQSAIYLKDLEDLGAL